MSEFSRALEAHIYRSGLTENQLAKISGFTRSYIALMKNGQRVSPDTVKLKKLLDSLSLSPHDYDVLWDNYLKARYGEQIHELHKNVISFLESFRKISRISIKSDFRHDIPEINTIDNRADLEVFIKAVIEQEVHHKQGNIRMIMQGEFSFLFNLLPSILRSGNSLSIEHIVCLEGNEGQEAGNLGYNLKTLGVIMPILMASSGNSYEVFYYYEKISSHFSNSVLMPYMIMTHEYVINISTDLEYALISRDRDTYKLFEQLFLQKKKNCRRMIRRIPTGLNFLQNFVDNRPSSTDIYTIGSQPCFGMFPVNDLLKKYCTPVSPEIFSLISNFFTENQKFYRQEEFHMTSYFTKSGIQNLMERGVLEELPTELYVSMEPDDRLKLLKMLITEIKSGKYKAYLLDTEKFLYPPELTISAFNLTEANIIYLSPEVEARFTIEEQSLTRIIYNFLEELKVSTIVFGSEETVAWLESTYAAYKNTGN